MNTNPQPQSLVVGTSGQVGAALAAVLGENVLPANRLASENALQVDLVALAERPQLAAELLAPLHLSAVYCVGGATDVERCESDHTWAMQTNCFGPAALAAASRDLPFVYFSTEYVFDGTDGPYSETSATHAISVYGKSKLEGEQRVLDAHPNPLIVRTTVVYGPDRQGKNFLYTLRRLLSSGQPMRVPADQISSPTYNVDLAHATAELVELGASGIFNVCGPEIVSRYDFALQAAEILGLDASRIQPVTTAELNQKAPRPLRAGMLIDKLRATLHQTSMRTNAEAIADWAQLEQAKVEAARQE
ncbi:MAG TPA: SDR family oxidoreductase [Acidobacteriaceae bacterium]|jgi:dTDP-4-dehydrorhamnose reductase